MRNICIGLVAFSTLAFSSPLKNPFSVNKLQSPSGCVAQSSGDQKVVFNSGPDRYSVFVPIDGNTYSLDGFTASDLKCTDESASGGPCISCDVKVDHTQILNAGTCAVSIKDDQGVVRTFTIGGTSGQLAFGTPGHPIAIACRSLTPQPSLADREATIGPLCPETGGSSVTLGVGAVNSKKYLMTVPADQQLYRVESPDEQLRCVGPLGDKYSMCLPCDRDISYIQVSEQAQSCSFNIAGYSYRIVLNARSTSTPYQLSKPGKLLDVMCGFTDMAEATDHDFLAVSEVYEDYTAFDERGEHDDLTCRKNENDILIRTWVEGSEYHTYVAPMANAWKFWQNGSEVGFIPVAMDKGTATQSCMSLSSHIDAALVEGPDNAYCDVVRIGPNDKAYTSAALYSGVNQTFDDAAEERIMVAVFCALNDGDDGLLKPLSARAVPDEASSASVGEVGRTALAEVSMPWALNTINRQDFSQTTCPTNGYHFTIMGADAIPYFPGFPADGQKHMTGAIPCVKLSDLSCQSCGSIGTATSITAEYQFGPCTVKTSDGRSFKIQHPDHAPIDTSLTPKVDISPAGVITEITCGH